MASMRSLVPLVVILALGFAAGPGEAHVTAFTEAKTAREGETFILLDLRDPGFESAPVFEGADTTFILRLARVNDSAALTNASAVLNLTSPDGAASSLPLSETGGGAYSGARRLAPAGSWDVDIAFTNATGDRVHVPMNFSVYPDLPFRIEPADPLMDVEAGVRSRLGFDFVERDARRFHDGVTSVTMRAEHWSNDHNTLLATHFFEGANVGTGRFEFNVLFPETGMYHVAFASEDAGFGYDDVPLMHLTALQALPDMGEDLTPKQRGGVMVIVGSVAALGLIGYFIVRVARE